MNRIDQTFNRLKNGDEKALVGFVTAGDPNMDISYNLIVSMCDAGLDVLELGVPFSDPTADGPLIQRASERALKQGATLKSVLKLTRQLREYTNVPIILFSYYNPILAHGTEAFYHDAIKAGADGVLVVDLPHEEADELINAWPDDALYLIRLVAPTTPASRMAVIAQKAPGFIYLVSKTGVTGSAGLDTSLVECHIRELKSITKTPVCAGFGISSAKDVREIAEVADGVVIGSAFEKIIEENISENGLPEKLADCVKAYKVATRCADKSKLLEKEIMREMTC